jgi:hypothetical protein
MDERRIQMSRNGFDKSTKSKKAHRTTLARISWEGEYMYRDSSDITEEEWVNYHAMLDACLSDRLHVGPGEGHCLVRRRKESVFF